MRLPQPSLFGPQLNPRSWHVLGTHTLALPSPSPSREASVDGVVKPSSPLETEPLLVPLGPNSLPAPPPHETAALLSNDAIASGPIQRPRKCICIDGILRCLTLQQDGYGMDTETLHYVLIAQLCFLCFMSLMSAEKS